MRRSFVSQWRDARVHAKCRALFSSCIMIPVGKRVGRLIHAARMARAQKKALQTSMESVNGDGNDLSVVTRETAAPSLLDMYRA